jgi:hypothetical protein
MSKLAYDTVAMDMIGQCFLLRVYVRNEHIFDAYLSKQGVVYLFVGPPPWYVDTIDDPGKSHNIPNFKYAHPDMCVFFEATVDMWDVTDVNVAGDSKKIVLGPFVNQRELRFVHATPVDHIEPALRFDVDFTIVDDRVQYIPQARMKQFYDEQYRKKYYGST